MSLGYRPTCQTCLESKIRQLGQKLLKMKTKQMKTPRPFLGGGSLLHLHGLMGNLSLSCAYGAAVHTLDNRWLCRGCNAQQLAAESENHFSWKRPIESNH